MSSLDALNARIDQLSSAIEVQKQVLRELEIQRSDVRRELNALRDPIARLPLEISSEVFEQCLAGDEDITALFFLGICRLWSHIALSTPSLWATIHSEVPDGAGFCQLFQTWLGRARSRLLYIWDCVEMMRAVPTLRDCEFTALLEEDNAIEPQGFPHLIHSSLRQLRLGEPQTAEEALRRWGSKSSCYMLRFLTLPALENLLISWFDISNDEFLSFLRRSLPPLQSLHMELYPTDVEYDWVPLVPSLVSLTLKMERNSVEDPIPVLDQMARDNNVLPNLLDLSLTCWPGREETYEDLVTVITSRRASQQAQLHSFQLIFPDLPLEDYEYEADCQAHKPHTDDIEVLWQLVEEGINIHVGPDGENYIQNVDTRGSGSE
ncbi:hypothetical protein C8R46DRAFT_366468 [Mycena filopes]|nr:hypothetical protein C8R46DRAFT_366468 [Mycena filopes]